MQSEVVSIDRSIDAVRRSKNDAISPISPRGVVNQPVISLRIRTVQRSTSPSSKRDSWNNTLRKAARSGSLDRVGNHNSRLQAPRRSGSMDRARNMPPDDGDEDTLRRDSNKIARLQRRSGSMDNRNSFKPLEDYDGENTLRRDSNKIIARLPKRSGSMDRARNMPAEDDEDTLRRIFLTPPRRSGSMDRARNKPPTGDGDEDTLRRDSNKMKYSNQVRRGRQRRREVESEYEKAMRQLQKSTTEF